MEKSYLLPHKCQKVGWWLLLFSLLLYIVVFVAIGYFDEPTFDKIEHSTIFYVFAFGVTCLPYIAMLLVCLSREKEEDEYVSHLRTRSLCWVVVYAFIVEMVLQSINYLSVRLLTLDQLGRLSYFNLATNPMILAVLYLLLFKGPILVNGLRSNKDE